MIQSNNKINYFEIEIPKLIINNSRNLLQWKTYFSCMGGRATHWWKLLMKLNKFYLKEDFNNLYTSVWENLHFPSFAKVLPQNFALNSDTIFFSENMIYNMSHLLQ